MAGQWEDAQLLNLPRGASDRTGLRGSLVRYRSCEILSAS